MGKLKHNYNSFSKLQSNANCHKEQYMVVKTASYCGLSHTKTCDLSDDYSREADVTCLAKGKFDGQHECSITLDNLFSGNLCLGSQKYLYFEYLCVTEVTAFNGLCGKYQLVCYGTIFNMKIIEVLEPTKCRFPSYNSSISVIGLFVDFFVVDDVLLLNSYLPNEGFVMIVTKLNGKV